MTKRIWDDAIAPEDRVFLERMYHDVQNPRDRWGTRPALLIIDMSYGFVTDDYPQGYAKTGMPCAQAIEQLLAAARKAGAPIVWTTGKPAQQRLAERGRWKMVDPKGRNMWEERYHEIYEPLKPNPEAANEHVLYKTKPSGFYGTEMAGLLNYYGCDTVIVTGMVTSGCVRATAVDAFNYNFVVIVPEEGTADRVQTSHKVSLFDLHMKYADVVSNQEALNYLGEAAGGVVRGRERTASR